MITRRQALGTLISGTWAACGRTAEDLAREQVAQALRRAVEYFRTHVATEGGYLWRYSADLKLREGERKATATQAWVQAPGTPAVGLAYLRAYEATRDRFYLEAAAETAHALVQGQLRSGGWDYHIEFDPSLRVQYAYRTGTPAEKQRNVTTLDDDNTQMALRFLMRTDSTLQAKDARIHEAAGYALMQLLKAQYPNGAWPQRYGTLPDPRQFPVKKAGYPDTGSRTFPNVNYSSFYTLNDDTLADMIETLLEAHRTYGTASYREAALRGGEFLLLAQMPDPQPAWAQQYDAAMHPAWARRFEPPAVTGGESFGAMNVLLTLYRATGDKRFLEPIPRALEFFRKVRLPDGRLARFYELRTNKPLYFTKDYQLTYSDADLPTHYAFKVPDRSGRIEKEYQQLLKSDPRKLAKPAASPPTRAALEGRVKSVLSALDAQGRWLESGRLRAHGTDDTTNRILSCQTFVANVGLLSDYLAATRP